MELKYREDKTDLRFVIERMIRGLIIWCLFYIILLQLTEVNNYLRMILGTGLYIIIWSDMYRTSYPNTYIFLLKKVFWVIRRIGIFYERNN